MVCPLCGTRKARRGCPALGRQICTVCCGTKRLVEIQCPPDCTWLASAREHPPAVAVRQKQRDLALLVSFMRDFNRRQQELFFLVSTFLVSYAPADLQSIVDDDVADAMNAIAATFETASRGVIYEHRPSSVPAGRLAAALKPVLAEAGTGGGSAFERDASIVLRRLGEAASLASRTDAGNRRALLDLLGRVIQKPGAHEEESPRADAASRLIIP